MCGGCFDVEAYKLVKSVVISDLTLGDRSRFQKDYNISNKKEFDRLAALVATDIRKVVASIDVASAEAVMAELGAVDWLALSEAEAAAAIASITSKLKTRIPKIEKVLVKVFDDHTDKIFKAQKLILKDGHSLDIKTSFTEKDKKMLKHIRDSNAVFIRGEFEGRAVKLEERVKKIVEKGMKQGLGRADIAENIYKETNRTYPGRSLWYWDVVASAYVGRARSFSHMSAYAEAGIQFYQLVAVLDNRTTDICRYLHNKVFSLGPTMDHLNKMDYASMTADEIKDFEPYWKEFKDKDSGAKYVGYKQGGKNVKVAEVTRSGFGMKNDPGQFRQMVSPSNMVQAQFPPFHALCRTTTIPYS